MKNLNPSAGLRQMITGRLYLPRHVIVDMIISKKTNVSSLGYFITGLVAADWDKSDHRYGIIRHDTKFLAETLQIAPSTLADNFARLHSQGVFTKSKGCYAISNFEDFQERDSRYSNKNVISDEELFRLFGVSVANSKVLKSRSENPKPESDYPDLQSEKPEQYKITEVNYLKSPFNDSVNSHLPINKPTVLKNKEAYQSLAASGQYGQLTAEDMEWLDEHIDDDGNTRL